MENGVTKVGCGILVFKEGKVLLGKRKGSHGHGMYGGPGGHFEYMESFEACVKREIAEECGIQVIDLKFLCVSNFKDHAPKHYVDLGFSAEWLCGEPAVNEPDRVESWGWYSLDNLPSPLFGVAANYFESLKTGRRFFDK